MVMAKFLCHATINVNFVPGKTILIEKKSIDGGVFANSNPD